MSPLALLLNVVKLTTILAGVGLIVLVVFLPVIGMFAICIWLGDDDRIRLHLTTAAAMQVFHVQLLWTSPMYLSFFRRLVYPIRMLLVPLVVWILRCGATRDGTATLYRYVRCGDGDKEESDATHAANIVVTGFRHSIRRRYRKMESIFRNAKIRHKTVWSEDSLHLAEVVPIMLEHERRCCARDGTNWMEEFVQRFLVVSLFPHALLDLYYNTENQLCSAQLSVQQGSVLHWQMYFCSSDASRYGIWFHGILTSLVRGAMDPSIHHVNGHVHQTESKQNAGFVAAEPTDLATLRQLYPVCFMSRLSDSATSVDVWSSSETK